MKRQLISEQTVQEAAKRGETVVSYPPDAVITDAARDRAKQLGIKFEKKVASEVPRSAPAGSPVVPPGSGTAVAIGSDHGGFAMKEALKPFLKELGCNVTDLGTYSEEACDYPDFAYAVAKSVALGHVSTGIMIDSVGIASAMVANKVAGVRAACCTDEFSARSGREHNDANVLTLGGKTVGIELAKAIIRTWLATGFGGGRHKKRVEKIAEIEKRSHSIG
jgi:ribose 5-phosphate isomerase B